MPCEAVLPPYLDRVTRISEVNKNLLIGGAVVLVLFLSLPLLASFKGAGGGSTSAPSADSPTPAAAAPVTLGLPPTWNNENLVGTSWNVSGYVVNLGAGGVASATTPFGQVQGTWNVSGSAMTVKAMGQEKVGQISGDQIIFEGKAAQRAN